MAKHFRIDVGQIEKPRLTPNGYLKADGLATRTGIFPYRTVDGSVRRELRLPDDVFNGDSLDTLKDIPITDDHPPMPLDTENTRHYSVGHTREKVEQMGDYIMVGMTITNGDTIRKVVNDGKRELSCGYLCDVEMTPGEWNGQPYDAIQRNIRHNHLAIVDRGRAGPEAKIKLDQARADGYEVAFIIDEKEEPKKTLVGEPSVVASSKADEGKTKKEGDRKMGLIKFKFDGIEYELPETLASFAKSVSEKMDALSKANDALKALQGDLEKSKGRVDALEVELKNKNDEIEKVKKEQPSEKEILAKVKARNDVEEFAKKILGASAKFDGLEIHQIKKEVVKKVFPSVSLEGKTDHYVDGMFDTVADGYRSDGQKNLESGIGKSVTTDSGNAVEVARQKQKNDMLNAWKNKS